MFTYFLALNDAGAFFCEAEGDTGIYYTITIEKRLLFCDTLILHALIAQLVEQLPLKEMVVGSTPTGRTTLEMRYFKNFYT